jgi:hypothetical protein
VGLEGGSEIIFEGISGEAVPELRGSGKPVFRPAESGREGEAGIWMLACILAVRERLRWRTCQSVMRDGSEFTRWWYLW